MVQRVMLYIQQWVGGAGAAGRVFAATNRGYFGIMQGQGKAFLTFQLLHQRQKKDADKIVGESQVRAMCVCYIRWSGVADYKVWSERLI